MYVSFREDSTLVVSIFSVEIYLLYVLFRNVVYVLSSVISFEESNHLERIEKSEDIYQLLVKHMGYENATFGGVFDLPLMILADDRDLRQEII